MRRRHTGEAIPPLHDRQPNAPQRPAASAGRPAPRGRRYRNRQAILSFYDPTGRLLTETTGIPGTGWDYLYVHGAPIGRVDWSVTAFKLGDVLRVDKNSPNVHLDWTLFPSAANTYVVRRRQVVNPNEKTFDGNASIATLGDPTMVYDYPVLNDGNRHDERCPRSCEIAGRRCGWKRWLRWRNAQPQGNGPRTAAIDAGRLKGLRTVGILDSIRGHGRGSVPMESPEPASAPEFPRGIAR